MTEEENHWTDKQEHLLIKWSEKAAGYRWLHNHARIKYKKQHDMLSYPTIIMSSITGVGGFAVLNPSESENEETKRKVVLLQYFFAFMNVMSGIMTSISKFNNSSKLMELHSMMCVQYSKFYRNIDMELSLERKDRVPALEFVTKCRMEYDRLLSEAPDIPNCSITEFNKNFKSKRNKPDVCNGLSVIDDCCDTPTKGFKTKLFELVMPSTRNSLDESKV